MLSPPRQPLLSQFRLGHSVKLVSISRREETSINSQQSDNPTQKIQRYNID